MRRQGAVLGLMVLLACGGTVRAVPPVLIKARVVHTLDGAPLAPGMVLIADGKIRQVATTITAPAEAKVLDLGDGELLPGFVNGYTQLGLEAGDSESTRELTPRTQVGSGINWTSRAFKESLAEGITTAAIGPGTANVIAGVGSIVKTAGPTIKGRIVSSDFGLVVTLSADPASGNNARARPDSIYVRQPTNRMGVIWMLRSTFDQARRTSDPEGAPLRSVMQGNRKLIVQTRTYQDLVSLLRFQEEFPCSPVVVGGHEAYKLREPLAAARIPVLLAPLTTSSRQGPEGTELSWNSAGVLHAAGVSVGLTGMFPLEQARFAVRFGLPKDAALKAITTTPAEVLGIRDRVGQIAPGKDADLVAVSGDPFDFTSAIRWVMVDGQVYDFSK